MSLKSRFYKALPESVYFALDKRPFHAFLYHMVSSTQPSHLRGLYACKSPELFEKDLQDFGRRYDFISYPELSGFVRNGFPKTGKKKVFLSFDDGYAECFSIVRPLLLKYKVPCTFFLAVDFLDNRKMFYRNCAALLVRKLQENPEKEPVALSVFKNKKGEALKAGVQSAIPLILSLCLKDEPLIQELCGVLGIHIAEILENQPLYMTAAEARQLAHDGFSLGAHGLSHELLSDVDENEQRRLILESTRAVSELSGQKETPFAFPFHGRGVRRRLLEDLKKEHPELGLFFDTGGLRKDASFVVNRMTADQHPQGKNADISSILKAAYLDCLQKPG